MRFQNRREAGKQLAALLTAYTSQPQVLVLGLPRGGVPVAYEIAQALHATLDVFVVRKLGVPGGEELAMGAIASGGVRVLNADVVDYLGISPQTIEAVTAGEMKELQRRELAYRGDLPAPEIQGRIVILVDDGMATGMTMQAAVASLRAHLPAKLIVAVPVAARTTCEFFQHLADEVICICGQTPESFSAVELWYDDFAPTRDEEVRALLGQTRRHSTSAGMNRSE